MSKTKNLVAYLIATLSGFVGFIFAAFIVIFVFHGGIMNPREFYFQDEVVTALLPGLFAYAGAKLFVKNDDSDAPFNMSGAFYLLMAILGPYGDHLSATRMEITEHPFYSWSGLIIFAIVVLILQVGIIKTFYFLKELDNSSDKPEVEEQQKSDE